MSTKRERREVYATPEWSAVREEVMSRAGNLCERCAANGRTVAATDVHHKQSIRESPEKVFEASNLEAICRECHRAEHSARAVNREWETFTSAIFRGEVLP